MSKNKIKKIRLKKNKIKSSLNVYENFIIFFCLISSILNCSTSPSELVLGQATPEENFTIDGKWNVGGFSSPCNVKSLRVSMTIVWALYIMCTEASKFSWLSIIVVSTLPLGGGVGAIRPSPTAMKFPSGSLDIITIHVDQRTIRECYATSLKLEPFKP